jgi:hypothetical protein
VLANADVETGAGLVSAGPIQSGAIVKNRQLILPAMEIPVSTLYRLVGVVHLRSDDGGARRQRKKQQCDEDSISHAPSFSLLIGEFV